MAVQIGTRPDSGFDDPIGMLRDCHRRIEHFLDVLCVIAQQARGRALTMDEQRAADAALHYFHESGPRHNMDEEESLFPRLRSNGEESILAGVQRLESEHHEARVLHDQVAHLLAEWRRHGGLRHEEEESLCVTTGRLQQLYRSHIHLEEEVVFPSALKHLDRKTLNAIGDEFKARRQPASV